MKFSVNQISRHFNLSHQKSDSSSKRVFKQFSKIELSILIGNAIDHFDTALYSFLAPVLAPIFFPNHSPIIQLILAYSVLATSLVTRPLGAFLFGSVANVFGPLKGLSYSLIGMALASFLFALLPGFDLLGIWAPILLIVTRMLRGICASGEGTIAKLYIMEGKTKEAALTISQWYQSFTLIGIVTASFVASFIIALSAVDAVNVNQHHYIYRFCFGFAALVGFIGYSLRNARPVDRDIAMDKNNAEYFTKIQFVDLLMNMFSNISLIWKYKRNILRTSVLSGFSYVTYSIPFVFLNSFVPLVSSISLTTMMSLNTALLIFDMIMIHLLSQCCRYFSAEKLMLFAALVLAFSIVPIFSGLKEASLIYVCFARCWVVIWGVIFLLPLNYWYKKLDDRKEQYLLVGMGEALGTATLGRLTPAICFWIWHQSECVELPALYVALVAIAVSIVLITLPKKVNCFSDFSNSSDFGDSKDKLQCQGNSTL